jgi:hypothetical protein
MMVAAAFFFVLENIKHRPTMAYICFRFCVHYFIVAVHYYYAERPAIWTPVIQPFRYVDWLLTVLIYVCGFYRNHQK